MNLMSIFILSGIGFSVFSSVLVLAASILSSRSNPLNALEEEFYEYHYEESLPSGAPRTAEG